MFIQAGQCQAVHGLSVNIVATLVGRHDYPGVRLQYGGDTADATLHYNQLTTDVKTPSSGHSDYKL